MQQHIYIAISIILGALVLLGIRWMSSPKSAVRGNRLSALSMFAAIILVLWYQGIISLPLLWAAVAAGGAAHRARLPMGQHGTALPWVSTPLATAHQHGLAQCRP